MFSTLSRCLFSILFERFRAVLSTLCQVFLSTLSSCCCPRFRAMFPTSFHAVKVFFPRFFEVPFHAFKNSMIMCLMCFSTLSRPFLPRVRIVCFQALKSAFFSTCSRCVFHAFKNVWFSRRIIRGAFSTLLRLSSREFKHPSLGNGETVKPPIVRSCACIWKIHLLPCHRINFQLPSWGEWSFRFRFHLLACNFLQWV